MAIPFLSDTNFPDNAELSFGNSSDLKIYHSGSHSYIADVGTGNLLISGTNLWLSDAATGENFLRATTNGAVQIYYDGAFKFATTSTGVDVNGTINLDNLTINSAQGTDGQVLTSTGTGIAWEDASGVSLSGGEASKVAVWSATDTLTHNDNFHFDTTNVRLGIGTTAPATKLEIVDDLSAASTVEYALTLSVKDDNNSINQLGGEGVGIKFKIAGNDATDPGNTFIGAGIAAVREVASDTDSSTGLAFSVSQNDENLDEAVRIDHDGNVGIGETAPNRPLVVSETRTDSTASDAYTTVVKSVQDSGLSTNPGTGGLKVQYTSTSSNVHAFGLVAGSSSSDFLTTGPMHFYTNSDLDTVSATGFAMQLDTSQRLILGSMTASQKLNVSGNITADRYYGNGHTVYYIDPNNSTTSAILNGKVGIGALTADHKLHLEESDTTAVFLKTENTAGALLVGNNSAGNSFVSSQTSGKDLLFETANTERVRVDSTGNVGINESSPSAISTSATTLHIKGSVASKAGAIRLRSSDNSVDAYIYPDSTNGMTIGTLSNHIFRINTNSSERLRIGSAGQIGIGGANYGTSGQVLTSNGSGSAPSWQNAGAGSSNWTLSGNDIYNNNSGNVGVGTSSPDQKLHVHKASAGTVSSNSNAIITAENSTNGYIHLLVPDANESGILFGNPSSSVNGAIIYNNSGTSNGLQFRTSGNSTKMVIDSSGNVGIGSASPAEKLHVNGKVRIGDYMKIDSNANYMGIIGFNRDTSNGNIYNSSYAAYQLQNQQGKLLLQVYNSGGSLVTQHAFDNSGNLGIGTTSPSTKLHVEGSSIIANSTTIDPDSYTNKVVAGAIADGSGWGITSAIGGNAGAGDSWAIGTNGNNLYMGYGDQANANSLQTFLQVKGRNVGLVPTSGSVGIGTSNPSTPLHVVGDMQTVSGSAKISDNWGQGFYAAEQLSIVGSYPSLALRNNSLDNKWLIHHDGNDLTFYAGADYDSNVWTKKVHVDSGGGGMGAQKFYDIDSTSYYVEPGGTSNLNTVLSSNFQISGSGGTASSSGGWFKIAKIDSRGGGILQISYTGGNFAPNTYEVKYFKDWSGTGTLKLEQYGNTSYITSARIRLDSSDSKYYLELLFSSNTYTHSFTIYHAKLLGYNATTTVYTGNLAAGSASGTTITEMSFIGKGTSVNGLNVYAHGSGWEDGLNLYSDDDTNKWNLLVDNGAADHLRFAFNSSEKARLQTDGALISYGQFVNNNNGFKSLNSKGMVGDYDTNSTATKIIWTIGDSWNTTTSMYGLAYEYNSTYGHHLALKENGTTYQRLSFFNGSSFSGTVTSNTDFRAPTFIDTDNTSYSLTPSSGSTGYWQVNTPSGYLQIGPQNSSYCHYTTDRPNHWFNTTIQVEGGQIRSYDEDLNLNRAGSTTNRIVIGSSETISYQNFRVNGQSTSDGAILDLQSNHTSGYNDSRITFSSSDGDPDGTIIYRNQPFTTRFEFYTQTSGTSGTISLTLDQASAYFSNKVYAQEFIDRDSTSYKIHPGGTDSRLHYLKVGSTYAWSTNSEYLSVGVSTGNLKPLFRTIGMNSYPTWNVGWEHDTVNNSTYGDAARFKLAGSLKGYIRINSSSVTYSTTSSDERLKKNIETWDENILSKFEAIEPKEFHFNYQEDSEEKIKGYVAQQMIDKFPEAYPKSPIDESGEEYYSFDPGAMAVYLMKAVKDLVQENKQLKQRIEVLENQ